MSLKLNDYDCQAAKKDEAIIGIYYYDLMSTFFGGLFCWKRKEFLLFTQWWKRVGGIEIKVKGVIYYDEFSRTNYHD
jgi:hypothetical protein